MGEAVTQATATVTPEHAPAIGDPQRRVLLVALGDDAAQMKALLQSADLAPVICDADALERLSEGAGAILTTDGALNAGLHETLARAVAGEGMWPGTPILVLIAPGVDVDERITDLLQRGNVTLLDRSAHPLTITSGVKTALRASERSHVQDEKLQVQALLAAIVESSDDAIVSKQLDGRILSWNGGAERLFGWTAQEAIGQQISLIIPPDRMDEEMMILDRLRRGERIDHYETVRVTKSGKRVEISLTISPIRDSSNRVVAASKVARDITQRREIEKALRDADRRKDEFLATLAHELRNPLAPIRNSLHILRVTGTSDPALDRVREILDRQVNHMVRLVDDLLEVSRITRGKIELRKERIDLATVFASAAETSKPLIDAGGHELVVSLPPYQVLLYADPVRLAQIFSNLLNNAAKYSEPGGRIQLSAKAVDGQVIISVRDSGIGIAAEMLPRVFEMFAQVESSIPRAQGGLGIGLTLVRSLVEMHGGRVEAESAGLGKGSEFIVTLPLAPTGSARAISAESGDRAIRHRVLIVDDNRDTADKLATMLTFLGADVRVANDGQSAVEALGSFLPNVAVLDLAMRGMSWVELARTIREHSPTPHMTLIALSPWENDGDRERTHAAGFDFHLIKPPDIDALRTLMVSLQRGEHRAAPRPGKPDRR